MVTDSSKNSTKRYYPGTRVSHQALIRCVCHYAYRGSIGTALERLKPSLQRKGSTSILPDHVPGHRVTTDSQSNCRHSPWGGVREYVQFRGTREPGIQERTRVCIRMGTPMISHGTSCTPGTRGMQATRRVTPSRYNVPGTRVPGYPGMHTTEFSFTCKRVQHQKTDRDTTH
eukprot:2619932-Rhodomonas_salina.3